MSTGHTPLTESRALQPDWYTRPDVYEFEIRQIIGCYWQLVGAAEQIDSPGDLIVREIAGAPILITRSPEGILRGFYNICQHRAGPLATCDRRGANRLKCAYHGWSYDLNGSLLTAPEMREATSFSPEQTRLSTIDVLEWNGLVFARLHPGPEFSDLYQGIEAIVGEHALKNLRHHTQIVYEVDCNWKVYADNFLEGYHLPFVHPELTQLVDYKDYQTELSRWWSLQRSPVEESGPYAAGEGFYFFVYPNTMLNFMPGRLQSNRIIPTGLTTCQVEFDFFYAPGAEMRAADDLRFSDVVQEQDRMICEHVQKGLTCGAYTPGHLSPTREAGVWHWQNLLRDAYSAAGLGAHNSHT